MNLHLHVRRTTVRHFDSKERLGIVCVLRQEVRRPHSSASQTATKIGEWQQNLQNS